MQIIEISARDGKSLPLYIYFSINVISDGVINEPDPDLILLDKKYDVPLDKEWTIKFNRAFQIDEISEIKVMKGNVEVPVHIYFLNTSATVKIKPIYLYEENTEYYIKVNLNNGKRYRMEFKTKSIE